MTIRISQVSGSEEGTSVLRVEGALDLSGVELLKLACADLRKESGAQIVLDVSGVTFINSESAHVLRNMRERGEFVLRGCRLFTHEVLEGMSAEVGGQRSEVSKDPVTKKS
jgi:anti-anti-sigma regulatory factor